MKAEIIEKYFPELTEKQLGQYEMLGELYRDWNAKINVISRKDIDNLYEHHVLHSLAIARMLRFKPGTCILDFGTGGGFPGIPLAIMFPECHFKLIDGTGKKIRVVVRKNISKESHNALPNGIICLKGGTLDTELQPFRKIVETEDISQWFNEEWFKEKYVIYLPL